MILTKIAVHQQQATRNDIVMPGLRERSLECPGMAFVIVSTFVLKFPAWVKQLRNSISVPSDGPPMELR